MWGEEAASISLTYCLLLAPSLRCLLSTSLGSSSSTSNRGMVWLVDKAAISSDRAVFHSGMRRMRSAMARQSWVMMTWLVVGDRLVRWVMRLDLRLVWEEGGSSGKLLWILDLMV